MDQKDVLKIAAEIAASGDLIKAIKFYKNETGAGLKEAKDAVESARDALSFTDAFSTNLTSRAKVTVNLDMLRRDGVFLQVHVDGLSRLKRTTTDAERGMAGKDIRKRLQTAGMTYTMAREIVSAYHSVENKIRQNLDRWSYDVNGFRPYRLLTWSAGGRWLRKHIELEAELNKINEWAISTLEDRRIETARIYADIAELMWRRIADLDNEGVVIVDNIAYEASNDGYIKFRDRMIADALASVPTEAEIRAIRTGFSVATAQLGSDILAELNDIDTQRLRARRLTAAADAQSQKERQRQIEAEEFRRQVVERVRAQLNEQPDPYIDAIRSLRNRMAKSARVVLAAIERNGSLVGRSKVAAQNMVETFRVMTMGGDDELLKLIDDLETRLSRAIPTDMTGLLNRIADMAEQGAENIRVDAQRAEKLAAVEFVDDAKVTPKSRKANRVADAIEF